MFIVVVVVVVLFFFFFSSVVAILDPQNELSQKKVFRLTKKMDRDPSAPDRSTRIFFQVCLCHLLNNTSFSEIILVEVLT